MLYYYCQRYYNLTYNMKRRFRRLKCRIYYFNRLAKKNKLAVLGALIMATAALSFSLAPVMIVNQIRTSSSYMVAGRMESTATPSELTSSAYKTIGGLKERVMSAVYGDSYVIKGGQMPAGTDVSTIGITSVVPAEGYNSGTLRSEIQGFGFKSGAAATLALAGEIEITASDTLVVSSSKISCSFDLTGKKPGIWTLNVANSDGGSAALADAFEIKTLAAGGVMINYPNPFNPLAGSTTFIYELEADADSTLLIFNISAELVYKRTFSSGVNGAKEGTNSIEWNGTNSFGEISANGVYFARVIESRTGRMLAKGKVAVSK